MKTRHFLTLVLAALLGGVAVPSCTQDFDVFTPCTSGEKVCGGVCSPVGTPELGCSSVSCTPCDLANASATCAENQCAIAACDGSFQNCDGAQGNGC